MFYWIWWDQQYKDKTLPKLSTHQWATIPPITENEWTDFKIVILKKMCQQVWRLLCDNKY